MAQLVKNTNTGNVEDLGLIPEFGRERLPFQCFGLENSMYCIVHGVSKSRTQLSDFHI